VTSETLPISETALNIAIVGAGCAGVGAARHLMASGAKVTIFEKSRGIGGRMATRRREHLSYDHGAQFFSARGASFIDAIAPLQSRGSVAPWSARWGRHFGSHLSEEIPDEPRFIGTGGMNHVIRGMAEGMTIVVNARVVDLVRHQHLWSLNFEDAASRDGFDVVILALPSPQVVPLVTGIADFAIDIAAATYAPCWALMVEFETPPPIAFDAIKIDDPVLTWAARNSSKPGFVAEPETWVVHAGPEWSLSYLEEPAEVIAETLLDRFRLIFGIDDVARHATAHRWRYALVQDSAGLPFFWDPAVRIGACGDWCLGPRVEAAFDSGTALAEAILRG